jgi:hypothetical protein
MGRESIARATEPEAARHTRRREHRGVLTCLRRHDVFDGCPEAATRAANRKSRVPRPLSRCASLGDVVAGAAFSTGVPMGSTGAAICDPRRPPRWRRWRPHGVHLSCRRRLGGAIFARGRRPRFWDLKVHARGLTPPRLCPIVPTFLGKPIAPAAATGVMAKSHGFHLTYCAEVWVRRLLQPSVERRNFALGRPQFEPPNHDRFVFRQSLTTQCPK